MKKGKILIMGIVFVLLQVLLINTAYCATSAKPDFLEYPVYNNPYLNEMGSRIATIIRNLGILAAVIILMVLGLKYMTGSIEEKASFKKAAIPYLIGSVLLFSAAGIAQLIMNLALKL